IGFSQGLLHYALKGPEAADRFLLLVGRGCRIPPAGLLRRHSPPANTHTIRRVRNQRIRGKWECRRPQSEQVTNCARYSPKRVASAGLFFNVSRRQPVGKGIAFASDRLRFLFVTAAIRASGAS